MNTMTRCPECNHTAQVSRQGSTITTQCNHCNYQVATTNFPEIYLDTKIYTIKIDNNFNVMDIEKIRILSKIFEKNFINIRKLHINNHLHIQKSAMETMEIKNILIFHKFTFSIEPEFNW